MRVLKNSYMDIWLIAFAIVHFIVQIVWAINFSSFSIATNILFAILYIYLHFFNLISVTHSFIHTPFFKSPFLNKFFYIFNSINVLFPLTYYNESHLLHHKYNNDPIENGKCNDPTSTYLYGKDGQQENAFVYCALAFFRDWTIESLIDVKKKNYFKMFLVEIFCIFSFISFFIYSNALWFFFIYIPCFLIGWFFINMQNYYEHYHATDYSNKYANSTSYYNKLYNIIMFNEGYHQEHHIRPTVHWRERPNVKKRFAKEMKEANARKLHVPLALGFLENILYKK